jgi:predicted dehydrogenase
MFKAGVIGLGYIGPAHVEALRRMGNAEVVAGSDVDEATTNEKTKILGIPKAYSDYRDLLHDHEIDVVHICTPNHLHYIQAKEALLAGKHVLCEKPLAMDSAEARELVVLAEKTGLVCAVHFNLRFYPLIYQARSMVKSGELGRILAINGSYQQDWLFYETDYNWRLEPEYSGDSRAVADIGSHWFDAVEFVTGLKTEKVCADFATFHPIRKKPLKPLETFSGKLLTPEDYSDINIGTEDYASVLIRFAGGAHGSFTTNQVAAGRKNRLYFEIYGDKAALAFDSECPNELWIGYRNKNNEILLKDPSLVSPYARDIMISPGGHAEGYSETLKHFFTKMYNYITEKSGVEDVDAEFPTFKAGLRELEICEAIVKSARSDSWQSV